MQRTFTYATGTFTVPTPAYPPGDSPGFYASAVWVGIDGDTCQSAILQTGIEAAIDDGYVYYYGSSFLSLQACWWSLKYLKLGMNGGLPTGLTSRALALAPEIP